MGIFIENLQDKIAFEGRVLELIEKSVEMILDKEGFEYPYDVSLMIVDNVTIREINLEHRKIDKPTDVLSFPILDMFEGVIKSSCGDFDKNEDAIVLGDIIISIEKALEQSLEYGHSFEREMIFLFTHGFYHLLGYDHDIEEREKKMLEKQNIILRELGLERI
ncbi:UNVERIFIED_CONTAM: putative rRNA maturation factor [Acetivibrio alkalicellulosi]